MTWDIFRRGTQQGRKIWMWSKREGDSGAWDLSTPVHTEGHSSYTCMFICMHALCTEEHYWLQVKTHILRFRTAFPHQVRAFTSIPAELPFSFYPLSESHFEIGCCSITDRFITDISICLSGSQPRVSNPSIRGGLKMWRGNFSCYSNWGC